MPLLFFRLLLKMRRLKGRGAGSWAAGGGFLRRRVSSAGWRTCFLARRLARLRLLGSRRGGGGFFCLRWWFRAQGLKSRRKVTATAAEGVCVVRLVPQKREKRVLLYRGYLRLPATQGCGVCRLPLRISHLIGAGLSTQRRQPHPVKPHDQSCGIPEHRSTLQQRVGSGTKGLTWRA